MRFEPRAFWRRWARYVLAAVLAHGLLALLLVGWIISKNADAPPPQMMVFELAPAKAVASATAAPTAVATAAPGPLARVDRLDLPPRREVPAATDGTLRAAELLTSQMSVPAPADTSGETESGAADSEAARSTDGDPPSDVVAAWNSAVLAHLEQFKRYPEQARRQRLEDQVLVRIQVDREGRVLDGRVVDSRGLSLLDAEARAMVGRADPLPAPPPEAKDADLRFVVSIEFTVGSAKSWMW